MMVAYWIPGTLVAYYILDVIRIATIGCNKGQMFVAVRFVPLRGLLFLCHKVMIL